MVAGDVGLVLFSTPESSQDYNQKKKIPIAPVVSEEIMKVWKINDEDKQRIADTKWW